MHNALYCVMLCLYCDAVMCLDVILYILHSDCSTYKYLIRFEFLVSNWRIILRAVGSKYLIWSYTPFRTLIKLDFDSHSLFLWFLTSRWRWSRRWTSLFVQSALRTHQMNEYWCFQCWIIWNQALFRRLAIPPELLIMRWTISLLVPLLLINWRIDSLCFFFLRFSHYLFFFVRITILFPLM